MLSNRLYIVQTHLARGQFQEAYHILNEMSHHFPAYPLLHQMLAEVCKKIGQTKQAESVKEHFHFLVPNAFDAIPLEATSLIEVEAEPDTETVVVAQIESPSSFVVEPFKPVLTPADKTLYTSEAKHYYVQPDVLAPALAHLPALSSSVPHAEEPQPNELIHQEEEAAAEIQSAEIQHNYLPNENALDEIAEQLMFTSLHEAIEREYAEGKSEEKNEQKNEEKNEIVTALSDLPDLQSLLDEIEDLQEHSIEIPEFEDEIVEIEETKDATEDLEIQIEVEDQAEVESDSTLEIEVEEPLSALDTLNMPAVSDELILDELIADDSETELIPNAEMSSIVPEIEIVADIKASDETLDEAFIAEMPTEETPILETPILEAPILEAPIAEVSVLEAPIAEVSILETPILEAPILEAPILEAPILEAPDFPQWNKTLADLKFEVDIQYDWEIPVVEETALPLHEVSWQTLQQTLEQFAPPIELKPQIKPPLGFDNLDDLIMELENAPRIIPRTDDLDDDFDLHEEELDDMVSETLAKIYAAQSKFEDAAEVYEKMARQQPEQAAHFLDLATQMRAKKKK